MTIVILGFASYKDGSFELIVQDKETGEETMLEGKLKPEQFEIINRILPTCVFVEAECVDAKRPDTNNPNKTQIQTRGKP